MSIPADKAAISAPTLVHHALAPGHGGAPPHILVTGGIGEEGLARVNIGSKHIPTKPLLPIELALEGLCILHGLGLAIGGKR